MQFFKVNMKLTVLVFLLTITKMVFGQEINQEQQVDPSRIAIPAIEFETSEGSVIPTNPSSESSFEIPQSESENHVPGLPSIPVSNGSPIIQQGIDENQQIIEGEGEGNKTDRTKRWFWPIYNHHPHHHGHGRSYGYYNHHHYRSRRSYCRHYHSHCYYHPYYHCENVCDNWGYYWV